MIPHRIKKKNGSTFRWWLAISVASLTVAGCSPPMPDITPAGTGDAVTVQEVKDHWFRLVSQEEPVIEVRPLVAESLVNALADSLLAWVPELSDAHPLYIHVSRKLDGGAVGDLSSGAYVAFELPASQQVAPVEQPDGSLLFEGSDLTSFLTDPMLYASKTEGRFGNGYEDPLAEFLPDGLPMPDVTIRLWLYREAGEEQLRFRVSAEASVDVLIAGAVEARVTLNGIAHATDGPEADGLVPGEFVSPDDWWEDDEW